MYEVALRPFGHHLVDELRGQLVGPILQRTHGLWPEEVGPDGPEVAVLRVIHVNERLDPDGGLLLVAFLGDQTGRGELVNTSLARSISMMSACFVIAQNG